MPASIRKSGSSNNVSLELAAETYDDMRVGTLSVGSLAQTPLSAISIPCFQVMIQAPASNGAIVLLGNELQGCVFELVAGSAVTIPINDVGKVYALSSSGTQTVNWIAMV